MKIADREIGPGHPVYIIAEAGMSHLGSFDLVEYMAEEAKRAGANALKVQFFDVDGDWPVRGCRCLTETETRELKKKCDHLGLDFLCTPHDVYAVSLVNELCPAIKVGSAAMKSPDLIQAIQAIHKPKITSFGEAIRPYTNTEIAERMQIFSPDVAALWCVSKYPAFVDKHTLEWINVFKSKGWITGWSSHTADNWAPDILAARMGISIIEKHIRPIDLRSQVPTSHDMKASIDANLFPSWCDSIRLADDLSKIS